MNAIIYYSNTFESYNISKYISDKTNYPLFTILELKEFTFDNIYLVFPIHYQMIPKIIVPIIKKLKVAKAIIIATYGKMSYGNVLNDCKKILNGIVVSAAYVPTKHTYIDNDNRFNEFDKIDNILLNMERTEEVIIKKSFRNPFSNLMPHLRHKLGVKIIKNKNCNNCGMCNSFCNMINNGKVNKKCIRCLKCISVCSNNALEYRLSFFMRLYLKKKKKNLSIVY